jgi:hypothetical protein
MRHEAVARRHLLHVAHAPGHGARAQVHGELRVVVAGEGVELAGARHHVQHVREVGHRADRVGEACACTNSRYSISLSAPLRLASCTPAWNSL